MKTYVAFRCSPDDEYLLPHFIEYYKSLKVTGFFSNLNYRLGWNKNTFDEFVERIKNNYPEIIFNVGPNTLEQSESCNLHEIYNLMKNCISENSYIIPADADEFHEYPFKTLEENINYLETNNFLYIKGSTHERVSKTGELFDIDPQKDIFSQCPNWNRYLFGKPKISLLSNLTMYRKAGIGHHDFIHGIDVEIRKQVADRKSVTHHFRWTNEGHARTQKWYDLWKEEKYNGYKNLKEIERRLKAYKLNLLEANWSSDVVNNL